MSIPDKTLCAWKPEQIRRHKEELYEITSKGKFLCMRCARVAISEDFLCKPKKNKGWETCFDFLVRQSGLSDIEGVE